MTAWPKIVSVRRCVGPPQAADTYPRPATVVTSGITAAITGRRFRARLLRRPPEQHPLQDREIRPQLLHLGGALRVPRENLRQHQPHHTISE